MDVSGMRTEGYVAVPYPESLRQVVLGAMASWQAFCGLPLDVKLQFSNGDRIKDFGYMFREDQGPRADNKEVFHVSRSQFGELERRAKGVWDERAIQFIRALDMLIREAVPLVSQFVLDLQEAYGLTGFFEEVLSARDRWTFRYLHYFKKTRILAHPHVDRGGFTLHLAETHSGGEYYGFDRVWRPWPIGAEQTIFFPSMGLQYRSRNELKALCHRVVLPESAPSVDRYSMVAFVDFMRNYHYDSAQGRLQDFSTGFNYEMPFKQFSSLFVFK